ncbi:hypothetical protein ACJMK2_004381, partial [Sinanodonta woodiana]
MKTDVLFLIAGVLTIVESVATGLETVWVRDMTAEIQGYKRELDDYDLPDQLTFNLRRGLNDLTLKLKRNYEINPNADIYVVQKLKNGRPFLAKSNDIETEAVSYYQDVENMAFVTVRCASRSNHKCDRVINGNVRIGYCNYDLRPVESEFESGGLAEVHSLIGKRYALLDQAHVENRDVATTCETNIEAKHYARFVEKQDHFRTIDATLPRSIADLEDKGAQEKTRLQKHDYYVKVAVLIDSGLWDIYASRVQNADPFLKDDIVKQKIREAYSHIINGVNLRYKTIDDPSISITIILQQFIIFQHEDRFPHNMSKVVIANGKKYIDASLYNKDFKQWVQTVGSNMVPVFDHAMLFTGYDLFTESIDKNGINGISPIAGVCDAVKKVSLIQSSHFYRTVLAAAHELGHNLGADHDGTTDDGKECPPDERYIMYYSLPILNATTPLYRNIWLFSTCSVESFKKTLKSKDCVKYEGSVYNTDEWTMFMRKEPGYVFTPNMQCYIIYGPHYVHYG